MSEDSYTRVVIQTVQDMTTAVYQVRADVNRAVNPLYQRIVAMEKRLSGLEERGLLRLRLETAIAVGVAIAIGLLLWQVL